MKRTSDHKGTVRKLTEEEARKHDTTQRPRPAWMPQDCADTPTRYLCRCFDHSARDAVDKVCFTTKIPPMALRDISCGGFTIDELIAKMLDELTFQSHNETYGGPVNTADLLSAFFDFLEYSVVPYLEKRHPDADGKGSERVAAAVSEIIGGVDAAEMVLAVPPAEFSRRVVGLLDVDSELIAGSDNDSRLARIEKDIAEFVTEVGINHNGKPKRKRNRHIQYKVALGILKRLYVPKTRQTLSNWMKGKNTPEGFTPETMSTIEMFAAWATIYANRERSKINTNNALHIDNPNNRRMGKYR